MLYAGGRAVRVIEASFRSARGEGQFDDLGGAPAIADADHCADRDLPAHEGQGDRT